MKAIKEKGNINSPAEKEISSNDVTSNKLAESENQIQRIFRQSPFTVALMEGENFIFRIVNTKAAEVIGRTETEIIGKSVFELMPELEKDGFREILSVVLKTGKPFVGNELPATYKKNGQLITAYFDLVYEPYYDESGKITGIISSGIDVTERVLARKKIEESEKINRHFAAIVQSSEDAIISKTLEGIVTSWNKSAEKIFGYTEAEMVGQHITKIIPEQRQEEEPRIIENILQGKIIEHFETQRLNKQRKLLNISLTISPIKDSAGKIIGASKTARNITEQVEARKKIEESEIKYRQLVFGLPVAVYICNAEGRILLYNEAAVHLWGRKPVIGKDEWCGSWKIFKTDGTPLPLEECPMAIALKEGRIVQFEIIVERPDGSRRNVMPHPQPLFDSDGKITGATNTLLDITEAKKVEAAIKIRSLGFESAVKERTKELSQANEALQQANQQVALSKYNKRFLIEFSEKFSTYKAHDEFFNSLVLYIADLTKIDYVLIGKLEEKSKGVFAIQTIAITAFGKLVDNINYPLPHGPCEQFIRGTLYSYPEKCRITFPKNQTLVQFNVEGYIGYPLFDTKGNAFGLIAVMHETKIEDPDTVTSILKITAKRAEVEMERLKNEDELEKNNKALEEKNRELVRMNKELESFTYVSSHDLQEPLRKIQTFAERILETENQNLSNKGKEYFHRMQEASQRMRTLIQDLLAFSKINSAERKFEYTDLNKIVEEVKTEFKETLEEKHATIETKELCEQALIIPFQFRQLMHNLIGNSLKFSKPQTPPHIIIKSSKIKYDKPPIKNLLPRKEYCHITVQDNGIGFEKHFSEKIFEVFQRLHDKEKYSGTGIGLAIVKKIVENHNGIITAEGELGKGARFDIYIPA